MATKRAMPGPQLVSAAVVALTRRARAAIFREPLALLKELMEYYRLISALEGQLAVDSERADDVGLTLRRLAVWVHEPLVRMKMLAIIVDGCKGLKGGALVGTKFNQISPQLLQWSPQRHNPNQWGH